MREEIQRISKMVAEGKISPEDAADLIDAFYAADRAEEAAEAPPEPGAPTPPPPPGAPSGEARDPFRSLIDSIEKLTKETAESVNWKEVSDQARVGAKKGLDALKSGIEEISKGKLNIGWILNQETKEVSLPLSVPAGKTLRIENPCGNVKIVGGFDIGTATAHAKFRAGTTEEAKRKAEGYTPIIEESDHLVSIKQPDVSGLHVDLSIQLAGHANVEVRGEAGEILILDTRGGVRINSRTGDVKLRGLDGVIEVTSESGNLSVEDSKTPSLTFENKSGNHRIVRVQGNINARTATGDIHLEDVSAKSVAVESVSGDIQMDLAEPVTGSVNVRTVNGNARIGVAEGSDCRVSLAALRGHVTCDLELQDSANQQQRITGRLGDGSGSLDVSAVTGNIAVALRDAASV